MLVLSRKANQSIMIGSDIRIIVVDVDRDQVKLELTHLAMCRCIAWRSSRKSTVVTARLNLPVRLHR